MHKYKQREKMLLRYPNYLSWSKAQWIVKQGDLIQDSSGQHYQVESVIVSAIPGTRPTILANKYDT